MTELGLDGAQAEAEHLVTAANQILRDAISLSSSKTTHALDYMLEISSFMVRRQF